MMKNNSPYLSIIVPLFNEEKRLEKGLNTILGFIAAQKFPIDLVIVNDGSSDKTIKILKNLKHRSFKLISYEKNQGKGFAVREGMRIAQGDYKLFIDIDLSTPLSEFHKFLPHLKHYDIVIGSRRIKDSKILVHQPILREYSGVIFTWLSAKFLNLALSDFTCGFKCFSKKAADAIFSSQNLKGWGFDSEILFLAKKNGFNIKEVPVMWSDDLETKVKIPKDILVSIFELLKVRYNDLLGRYR